MERTHTTSIVASPITLRSGEPRLLRRRRLSIASAHGSCEGARAGGGLESAPQPREPQPSLAGACFGSPVPAPARRRPPARTDLDNGSVGIETLTPPQPSPRAPSPPRTVHRRDGDARHAAGAGRRCCACSSATGSACDVTEAEAAAALRAEIAYYRAHMGDGRDARTLRELRLRCAAVLREALPAGWRARSSARPRRGRARCWPRCTSSRSRTRGPLLAVRARGRVDDRGLQLGCVATGGARADRPAPLLDGVVVSAASAPPSRRRRSSTMRCRSPAPGPRMPARRRLAVRGRGRRAGGRDRAGAARPRRRRRRVAGVRAIGGLDELGWPSWPVRPDPSRPWRP